MAGRDLASLVSPSEVVRLRHEQDLARHLGESGGTNGADGAQDDGAPDGLAGRGSRCSTPASRPRSCGTCSPAAPQLELHPCTSSAEEVLAGDPDAVLLANGPGDPAAVGYAVGTIRELLGTRPVWGICLGHQLLCRALGLETFKLPFGHRGANHPVKDLRSGRVAITSQNHGFAVLGPGGERQIDERASRCSGRPSAGSRGSRT